MQVARASREEDDTRFTACPCQLLGGHRVGSLGPRGLAPWSPPDASQVRGDECRGQRDEPGKQERFKNEAQVTDGIVADRWIGGFIFFKGVAGIRRELRLHSEGMSTQATVEEVEPTNYSFNEVTQWRIRYRYRDHQGLTHQGQSNLMRPEEAQAWKAGDEATVLFDAGAPEQSVWVGRQ
jgi:hypothetical protein